MDNTKGTRGDDTLKGTQKNDLLNGLAGDDTISGFQGDDVLNGGRDNDIIYGNFVSSKGSKDGNDVISGGKRVDLLYGDSGNDILSGGSGDDFLEGGKGDDILDPGKAGFASVDQLSGGSGRDLFVLSDRFANTEFPSIVITDFTDGKDKLWLTRKLQFSDLKIVEGNRGFAGSTLIKLKSTGDFLASLDNVEDSSLITSADFQSGDL